MQAEIDTHAHEGRSFPLENGLKNSEAVQEGEPTYCPVSHIASADAIKLKWKLMLCWALRRSWE